ncbi:MAG TPA: hypothetical protein VFY87_06920 [Geminicoccaceae bacterium]|jgi:hypothetical protein|nr:hypothetical protein [Geminicoccaceae bacterium]
MPHGYRQGDIFIEPVLALPAGCAESAPQRRAGELVHVLAEGELTGHAHRVLAGPGVDLLRDQGGNGTDPLAVGYLRLKRLARLVHDEHTPVDLPPGNYRVVQQRRYDPQGPWRRGGD